MAATTQQQHQKKKSDEEEVVHYNQQRRKSEIELHGGDYNASPPRVRQNFMIRWNSEVPQNQTSRIRNFKKQKSLCTENYFSTDIENASKYQTQRRASASDLEIKHFQHALNVGAFKSEAERSRKQRRKSFEKSKRKGSQE